MPGHSLGPPVDLTGAAHHVDLVGGGGGRHGVTVVVLGRRAGVEHDEPKKFWQALGISHARPLEWV